MLPRRDVKYFSFIHLLCLEESALTIRNVKTCEPFAVAYHGLPLERKQREQETCIFPNAGYDSFLLLTHGIGII
jgi:hypothetical protein